MKELLAKFLSLSIPLKVVSIVVPLAIVGVAVATPIVLNNKEAVVEVSDTEETVDEAEVAKAEPTVEPTAEPTVKPTVEPTTEPIETEEVVEDTVETVESSDVPDTTPEPTADTQTDEYTPSNAGDTLTVEAPTNGTIGEVEVKVPSSYSLPYIVNGVDIRDGDFNKDGVNDNFGNTWYEGKTWTASNGVVLRIADGYTWNHPQAVFIVGTENLEPNSDFMKAYDEFTGEISLKQISAADLPLVNLATSKQTSINRNDPSFIAYKAAFDPLWSYQVGASYTSLSQLQVLEDGIGLLEMLTCGYIWEMHYDSANGYWKLILKSNMTELEWNSIRNSLRMITPDGETVYNEIYYQFYYDSDTFPDYDMWVMLGNTEVMIPSDAAYRQIWFYIR